MENVLSELQWMIIFGGIVAFVVAFGIGANDLANAFATSVGSKTLTLKQAIMVGAVFEFSGALFMGSHVTSTIRKGIIEVSLFDSRPDLLILAMLSALIGTAIWLLVATRWSLPVSTTHTIVGGILGVGLTYAGTDAVQWSTVWLIIASWALSPLLSGILAFTLFKAVRYHILRQHNSLERGFAFYPFLTGFTLSVNVFFIIFKGTPALNLGDTPLWLGISVSLCVGIVVGSLVFMFVNPYLRLKISEAPSMKPVCITEDGPQECDINEDGLVMCEGMDEGVCEKNVDMSVKNSVHIDNNEVDMAKTEPKEPAPDSKPGLFRKFKSRLDSDIVAFTLDQHSDVKNMHGGTETFDPKTERMFSYLQVFTAVFDSFVHGANDVSNSIAPFAAMYGVFVSGGVESKSEVAAWILALGGIGIVAGLAFYGHHIISAIGVRLTKITPSRGFSIEMAAATVVVLASRVGIPVSTTHCQVGASVAVGIVGGKHTVNWPLLLNTVLGWGATLIIAALLAAAIFSFVAYSPSVY